jgi:hypothetical protein
MIAVSPYRCRPNFSRVCNRKARKKHDCHDLLFAARIPASTIPPMHTPLVRDRAEKAGSLLLIRPWKRCDPMLVIAQPKFWPADARGYQV